MLIDVNGLEDNVDPQIEKTRKYLELGKDALISISIPSDFSYRTKLRNISQTIMGIDSRINTIDRWLNETISNFSNVETNNNGLMESLLSAIPTFLTSKKVVGTGKNTASILSLNDFVSEIKSNVNGAFDYVFSGEWITDSIDMAKKTASKVSDKVELANSLTISTGAEIKENVTNCESTNIESGLEFVGGKLSDAWDFTYQNIITPTWNFLEATGASVANAVIGFVKGFCQLIENFLDFIVMLVTGAESIFIGVADGITYLVAIANDDTENWSSITGLLWKDVMEYVAEDHVENAFKSFYSNNVVGQWLDENAIDIFKSDGIGTNIISGVGYVAGITFLTISTLRNRNSCNWCSNNINNSSFCRYSCCGWDR